MNNDAELLRSYAEQGSESAFTELVRRHVDLVYGAALRRVGGDSHHAADVAQRVFTSLAREAPKLLHHSMLPAWLHTATRNAAVNLMIAENRRTAREIAAFATTSPETGDATPLDWGRVRPVLDAAIDELPDQDRVAVLARFFERKPFAELGAELKISADAARMRTERGLEKLRGLLARRGITSTAVALETLITGQSLIAAPSGLAATLAAHALVSGGAGAASAGIFLTLMNAKVLTVAGLSVVAALGLGFYLGAHHSLHEPLPPQPETPLQIQRIASLRQENLQLKVEVERLNLANQKVAARLTAPPATHPVSTPTPPSGNPLLAASQQKAMMNNLRQISAALDQYLIEHGQPPASIDDLVGEEKYIRKLVSVDGENYSSLTLLHGQIFSVTTQSGATVTYNPAGDDRRTSEPIQTTQAAKRAFAAYTLAHPNTPPTTPEDLLPYFSTPQEGADFVEALEAQKNSRR